MPSHHGAQPTLVFCGGHLDNAPHPIGTGTDPKADTLCPFAASAGSGPVTGAPVPVRASGSNPSILVLPTAQIPTPDAPERHRSPRGPPA
jgi:hypothetical protein